MSYFNWHQQPGYFGDITRHFQNNTKILDVGCGTAWLADHFQQYTGVDASHDAVDTAIALNRNVTQANVDEPLPFEDCSFEGIILKDLLEHVDDPVEVVREAYRVLRPGGKVFASSPDAQRWVWNDYTHKRPFTRKAFNLLFRDCGFTVKSCRYESIIPGSSIVSGWTAKNRRPLPLIALAWLPFLRRNVWILAQRPQTGN